MSVICCCKRRPDSVHQSLFRSGESIKGIRCHSSDSEKGKRKQQYYGLQEVRRHTSNVIDGQKRESWQDFVSELDPQADDYKMWRILRAIETSKGSFTSMCPPNGSSLPDIARAKWFVRGELCKARTSTIPFPFKQR